MDYDDNDFQSQNFQLAGEESYRFPPIPRRFSLPKFDIEEQLQAPLRFDSLIEPDSLFSIPAPGRTNNWIQDFSPGNSAIEFTPSAGDSCSISRTNNVWSEATSSESVEMLLKSVREEDEMAHNMDGDAHARDNLNGMDRQHTDPNPLLRQEETYYTHIVDIDTSMPQPQAGNISQSQSRSSEKSKSEEKSLEDSLGSTKLLNRGSNYSEITESSDGLLEAITYPLRNLTKESYISDIGGQFGNVDYSPLSIESAELIEPGEERKELSDNTQGRMGNSANVPLVEQNTTPVQSERRDFTEQGKISKEGDAKKDSEKSVEAAPSNPDSIKRDAGNNLVSEHTTPGEENTNKGKSVCDHATEEVAQPTLPAAVSVPDSSVDKAVATSIPVTESKPSDPQSATPSPTDANKLAQDEAGGGKQATHATQSAEEPSPTQSNIQPESRDTVVPSETKNDAQQVNAGTEDGGSINPSPSILPESRAEPDLPGTETDNPSPAEATTCGSPTIISCSQSCPDETKEAGPSSADPKADSNKDKSISDDDKSFSFKVDKVSDSSTGTDWKPFPTTTKSSETVAPKEISSEVKKTSAGTSKKKSAGTDAKSVEQPKKQKKGSDRSPAAASLSPGIALTSGGKVKLVEMKKYPVINESSSAKPAPASPVTGSSSLPDLNASVSSAALTHQPFTDLQHVQLRAQIFVYGSLIQGVPPGEAYMISAFGESGGGRAMWEAAWRTAVDRCQSQKSPLSASETPTSALPSLRTAEKASKDTSTKKSPGRRAASKSLTSASPSAPVLSPAVSTTTLPRATHLDFNQAGTTPITPLYSYQSLNAKQPAAGNVVPWLSPGPHPAPWVVSPQSSIFNAGIGTPVPAVPATEASKITPRRKTSASHAPTTPLVLPGPFIPSTPAAMITTAATVSTTTAAVTTTTTPVMLDESRKMAPLVSPPQSIGTTQKTRKRRKASSNTEIEPVPPPVSSSPLVSSGLTVPPNPLVSSGLAVLPNPPVSSGLMLLANSPQKVVFSGQLASSTSLVTSSPAMTYQMITGSTIRGPVEQRLILPEETHTRIEQSKQQADDAAAHAAAAVRYSQGVWSQLAAHRNSGMTSDLEQKLASAAVAAAAAASVAKAAAEAAKVASEAALQAKLMADEAGTGPTVDKTAGPAQGSFISMARAAARKRVEAASAAAKRAENLDAVLRAAEIAAEAVSQAGVVVAMGDPLPFSVNELLEAGPEKYWKLHFSKVEKDKEKEKEKEKVVASTSQLLLEGQDSRPENQEKGEKVTGSSQPERSHPANNEDGAGESRSAANQKGNSIRKGSLVEVLSDEDGARGMWFLARVLEVEDNRAYICYNDRQSDEVDQLKEWIVLHAEGDKAPRVRKPHPMTSGKMEGTRKRRREVIGNYSWTNGDYVDAWIKDGWREGVVTGKTEADGTKYTVQFPGGDSLIVDAWNLRPSLVWKDGQWSIWSRPRERTSQPKESESPFEKRQRLGQLESDNNLVTAGNTDFNNSKKPEESRSLNLSTSDTVFTVGKFTGGETNAFRRAGPQKEGSRVVFGVPRPGKKRKFMEVSKHYDTDKSDKSTTSESNPPVKVANYLMPQNRVVKTRPDPKGKGLTEPKSRGGVKSQTVQVRSSANDNAPASNGGQAQSGFGTMSEQRAPSGNEFGGLRDKSGSVPDPPSRKKVNMPVEHEFGNNKKRAAPPPVTADPVKSVADAGEPPRRSNRRIQPTSRLLEGLQSSLMIAKIPSEKGARAGSKGASSSKGRVHS